MEVTQLENILLKNTNSFNRKWIKSRLEVRKLKFNLSIDNIFVVYDPNDPIFMLDNEISEDL